MKILELFAGSRSLGNEADRLGHTVFSVDWTKYDNIDLAIDIGDLEKEQVPFIPDMVWASPDCATYSIAGIRFHRRNAIEPISEYAKKCDEVNTHFLKLIREWLKVKPDLVFFIENPRGTLRKMPFMQAFERHTVWYCQYGDNRAKPTDIWTNCSDWTPRPVCRKYTYDKAGGIVDRHCHHDSARRGGKTGTQGRRNAHERSKIPKALCLEIIGAADAQKG